LEMINYTRYARLALKGLFYFLLVLVFSDWCLMMSFAAASRTPIPSEGKIYSYNMHGVIVYVTRPEHLITDPRAWMSLIGLTALVGFCGQKMEAIEKRRKLQA